MSEKDRKIGNVAKENGNLLEGEGEADCTGDLPALCWLQYAKFIIVLDSSDNLGTKILS